jgi:hypothetical protein
MKPDVWVRIDSLRLEARGERLGEVGLTESHSSHPGSLITNPGWNAVVSVQNP